MCSFLGQKYLSTRLIVLCLHSQLRDVAVFNLLYSLSRHSLRVILILARFLSHFRRLLPVLSVTRGKPYSNLILLNFSNKSLLNPERQSTRRSINLIEISTNVSRQLITVLHYSSSSRSLRLMTETDTSLV